MTEKKEDPKQTSKLKSDDDEFNTSETFVLPSKSRYLRQLAQEIIEQSEESNLLQYQELVFYIRGLTHNVPLKNNLSIILGRIDEDTFDQVDVDLNLYGGSQRGVSRVHARVHIEDAKLYITDLGSTNGTFIAQKKLEPNEPQEISNGDKLLLGRLPIEIQLR